MKRLQLIVEGQTEEILATNLLLPHFASVGWTVSRPMILKTKVVADGADHKGGIGSWPRLAQKIRDLVDGAGGPELVNDGPSTAPSKRLIRLIPAYQKLTDGPLAVLECGLEAIREQCPHFDAWIATIEEAA